MEYKTADRINEGAKIYQKIQTGKILFRKAGVKKTGRNNFQKYSYFTLGEITSAILPICEELKLSTRFNFSTTAANLIIRDEDDGTECCYSIPLPEVHEQNARKAMQEIGAIQTYARRYLYLQAFEIDEVDIIDNGNNDDKESNNTKGERKNKTHGVNGSKQKSSTNKQYIQKKREVKPDMAEPVNQSRLTMNKKVSTTELVNMSKQVEQALKNEGKQLNEENIHSKVDELYKNSRGYNELIRMFDNGLKKAKKQESGYITY